MKNFLATIGICFFSIFTNSAEAQSAAPFAQNIRDFKKQDSVNPPPRHAVLFVGSSSFTMWMDIREYFPGIPIINRGFGGSSLPDLIRYAGDIIFPYDPKQILIYCGDNDFVMSDTVTEEVVTARVKKLFWLIREKLPQVNIAYISIKPSPARARFRESVAKVNTAIKYFLSTEKNAEFIDVFHLMLGEDGKPIPSIFRADSLHMNPIGYAIWKKAIEPYLMK
jgi:lysophospholipase L1-like esterase